MKCPFEVPRDPHTIFACLQRTSQAFAHIIFSRLPVAVRACVYAPPRYRVYWGDRLRELRHWSKVYSQEDVGWLKSYNDLGEDSNTHTPKGDGQEKNEGPGHGNYIFYLRAVDPAGNEDLRYQEGRNM